MNAPRLGSASMIVSFSDKEGFVVRHGTCNTILAQKAPELCDKEWDALWAFFKKIGVERV